MMSSTSPIQTIFGSWRRSLQHNSSSAIDLEAQTQTQIISGTQTPDPIIPPQPTHTHVPSTHLSQPSPQSAGSTDPIDDFFGDTVTHHSRHDIRLSTTSTLVGQSRDMPPPYPHTSHRRNINTSTNSDLPAYAEVAPTTEPITLARYVFKYGFLFPPLWFLGLIILLTPLPVPADFHADKPESERTALVEAMRRAEVKWAKRCAWALAVFVFVVGAVVGVVVGVMRGGVGM